MIYCKNCGKMLDDDVKYCTECGTATENADANAQNGQTGAGGQSAYDPNMQNPYGYPPYPPYPPYGYEPRKRPINVSQLVFSIINFFLVGLLAILPLIYVLNARSARSDHEESREIDKAKRLNFILLVVGIIIMLLTTFTDILTTLFL